MSVTHLSRTSLVGDFLMAFTNGFGQPARVAGLSEPHGSEIFLSGYLASGISKKRPPLEGSRDDLGLSLGRGRITDLWSYEFHLFLKIASRAKSPSSHKTLESKVFLFSFIFRASPFRNHRLLRAWLLPA